MTYHPRHLRPVRRKRASEEILPFYERRPERPLPHRFYVVERRKQATLLRIAGFTNTEIGTHLHADPTVNPDGTSFMGGYGWTKWVKGEPPLSGKALAAAVSKDLSAHLAETEESLAEAQEQARQLELIRYDKAQQGIWQRVVDGNDWAIDRFLAISDRRVKLLGLDVKQVDLRTSGTVTIQHGLVPEVDADYASAMLEGMAALAQGTDDGSPDDEIIDVDPVD